MISKINIGGIKMAIQDKFNRTNTIYKITKDIDLGGETLTIPEGCTLDFQGGKITNGTLTLWKTKIFPMGCNISDYITATIQNQYAEGQVLYDPDLKQMKLYNGSTWVNLDGTPLTQESTLQEVPASQDTTY